MGEWAKASGLWITQKDFDFRFIKKHIGGGAEQSVYLHPNNKVVYKVNQGRFHVTWLDYFNRLLFHAYFFPSTAYTLIGFTEVNKEFAVITEQNYYVLEKGASRYAVENFLTPLGFARFKNDDYYNASIGVKLEDLHDENIFCDPEANLIFIDPVVYFETIDLKLFGNCLFRFPFE